MLHMLEVCEVRSSFVKLMIMITRIKMMQIPYLIIAPLNKLPHTSYSSHFFRMFKDMLVQTLS